MPAQNKREAFACFPQHLFRTALLHRRCSPCRFNCGDSPGDGLSPGWRRVFRYLEAARHRIPFEIRGSIATRRPLVERADPARAYRLLMERPKLKGHFNARAETGVPMAKITRGIARRQDHDSSCDVRSLSHVLIKYGDWAEGPALDQQMGSAKLRQMTGWEPQYTSFRNAQF